MNFQKKKSQTEEFFLNMEELKLLMKESDSLPKLTECTYSKLVRNIGHIDLRAKEEALSDKLASETLQNLNLNINQLPLKCQKLVQETSRKLASLGFEKLEMLPIFLEQSKLSVQDTADEEELLELRLGNEELQMEIDANKKFIEDFKIELESQKMFLYRQKSHPEYSDYNDDHIMKDIKLKLGTFNKELEKAQNNYSKLQVPESLLPKHLQKLIEQLAELKKEEAVLKEKADDILSARQARETLVSLCRGEE